MALDPHGPDYVLFCSGVGAGKTLVGCVTVLTWALLHPGTYLITRQFSPELSDTTLKQFLDICPPELIKEHRVADRIIRIKSQGGKVSDILFRPAEEPEKWRSLNLSGAYLDESSQISEAAFWILQGRMRGAGLRKIVMTTNPAGHDWQWRLFVHQDGMKEAGKKQFGLVRAYTTENTHLPPSYIKNMLDTYSEDRIRREIYGDFDSFSGQVYSEFRYDQHVIKPFVIPDTWTRIVGADHGLRNPACWLWGAIDYDENVYIYREFYEKEWLIEEICKGRPVDKPLEPGVVKMMGKERILEAYIDPSVTQRRGQTGFSDYDHYLENLPAGFPLKLANNDVKAGIERVKQYLKVSSVTGKPQVFIFDTCKHLIEEIAQYRYAELSPTHAGKKTEDEHPLKVNDHSVDAFRYLLMSRPEPPKDTKEIYKNMPYDSLQGNLYRQVQSLKNPKPPSDPFGD